METLEVLRKARLVITPYEKWSSNDRGHEFGWGNEGRGIACAVGACAVVATGRCSAYRQPALDALAAAMGIDSHPYEIADWNDNHSHAEVLAAFDRAIAAEEAKLPREVIAQAVPRQRGDVGCRELVSVSAGPPNRKGR